MSVDPAFKSIPRGQSCFIIWRIEDFQLVQVPRDQYGSFFTGDSYLMLAQRDVKGKLDVRIHFWLGSESSQDECGTAAIKAVELDDHLGGTPVQTREIQGRESKPFLNYFKTRSGIKYMPGGVKSGFNHVDHTFKPRLMHVKGKSCPRIREVEMGWGSMNAGDAYILDIGAALYVWNGSGCSRTERIKAMEYARKLRDDRGKGNIIVVEDGEESTLQMGDEEYKLFDEYLPKDNKSELQSASESASDDAFERKASSQLKLWKVSDEGGSLQLTEVGQKPLTKSLLDTNDCFIVDNGEAGIWVWCGRRANKNEKKEAMNNAMEFVKLQGYTTNTPVHKVHESGETTEFKSLFKVWEKEVIPGSIKAFSPNRIAKVVQTKFDASTLHENPAVARETGMVDDGSGTRKMWRIERKDSTYEMVPQEKRNLSTLYGGDSYIILYTYLLGGRENYIIYFWLGRKSTQDEKGVAAKKAVELDDSLSGAAKQVRVVQGKEPNHFLAMFGGRLLIFEGGKAGWGQHQDDGPGDTYLMHIRGTSIYNTKAEQVACRAESLNSNDVFVLFSKSSVFVWSGKGCTGDEREMAKKVASISPRTPIVMVEGQEKEEFWTTLGGKTEYSTSPRMAVPESDHPPRLFQCSNASGAFTVNEIIDFTQQDLVPEDVFILDAYDNVFVWVGEEARPEEKTMAMDTAIEYVETDPSGRDEGTPIFMLKQGMEPPDFVGYFGVWDRDMWSGGRSYDDLKKEMGSKNVSMQRIREKSQENGDVEFSDIGKYEYSILRQTKNLPDGIDKHHKEKHMSDEEFQKVFSMTYAKFVTLPQWKQQQLKKEHQLW